MPNVAEKIKKEIVEQFILATENPHGPLRTLIIYTG